MFLNFALFGSAVLKLGRTFAVGCCSLQRSVGLSEKIPFCSAPLVDDSMACEAMGADFGYIGSAFVATKEANADDGYKNAIVECSADDIVYTNLFTGVHGNYLRPSIIDAGLDPDNLPVSDPSNMNFGSGGNTDAKAWKDIWGCGQGIGAINEVPPAADFIANLAQEYETARKRLFG